MHTHRTRPGSSRSSKAKMRRRRAVIWEIAKSDSKRPLRYDWEIFDALQMFAHELSEDDVLLYCFETL